MSDPKARDAPPLGGGPPGTAGSDREAPRRPREGAVAREERFGHLLFGHLFQIRAAGRDAGRTPKAPTARLGDCEEETERRLVREEPTKIILLRPNKPLEHS